jgi:UDP-N-acetylmuramyl tripeptide synthase
MINIFSISIGKTLSLISKTLNLGHGSTWPGHIALKLNPDFISDIFKNSQTKIIFVTGTNGKTTTAKMLETILKAGGKKVFSNISGANLLNGVASSLITNSSINGEINADFAIFEIDENILPLITKNIEPDFLIALNLFRDQLDRYGELDSIEKKWRETYKDLNHTTFILDADDPKIAFLGNETKNTYYFGLSDKTLETKEKQHASDSTLCPRCGENLYFEYFYFSHLGKWNCKNCKLKRPELDLDHLSSYPMSGTYSMYDTLAAVLTAKKIGIPDAIITNALIKFEPAFGRQEEITFNDKKVQLFLSKNPASFNESLRTINKESPKGLLIALNDRIPDGTDVSWIWDIDFENFISNDSKLFLAGDRVYDLALRLKYAGINREKYEIFENISDAVYAGIEATNKLNTFYVLPTYSAMLETRKILTGKKIL